MIKRSSCASGSGKQPIVSTGFCVAMTKNGASRTRVFPSTVTCPSAMHSSRLDCVLGVARLISSASRTFVKTGPSLNVKAPFSWLKNDSPVTSLGSRSGVNCTLSN